jgi:serine phosphatase RsbU (regulator of sigma subunit)
MDANENSQIATKKSESWLKSLKISYLLSIGVGLAVLTASVFVGFYAFRVLHDNKMTDTWAIMFLELERQGTLLARELDASLKDSRKPDGEYSWRSNLNRFELISGGMPRSIKITDLGLDPVAIKDGEWPSLLIVQIDGENFLMRKERIDAVSGELIFRFWRVGSTPFSRIIGSGPSNGSFIYLMSREGKVIVASDSAITVTNIAGRPLVQKFIRSPLTRGQLEFTGRSGRDMFGFYYEIPRTNVVMFSEVEKRRVIASIYNVLSRFILVLVGIIVATLLAMQLPLRKVTRPLREMTTLALKLGQGDFSVRMASEAYGELRILSRAFTTMTENLIQRDESIRRLMGEHDLKVRMEGELEIARKIQGNLLPDGKIPAKSGLEIVATYQPAGECAGDWYNYFFNESVNESIVVIVDVSGHGAGSSMFTAMIAALFEQYKNAGDGHFPTDAFLRGANRVIHRLGKKAWHATTTIVRHIKGSGKLEVFFGGHTAAFFFSGKDTAETSPKGKKLQKGSQPLGISEEFPIISEEYDFPPGSRLVLYTDGLTEARNHGGKLWGEKALRDAFVNTRKRPLPQSLQEILGQWEAFRGGRGLLDDACVVLLRAA